MNLRRKPAFASHRTPAVSTAVQASWRNGKFFQGFPNVRGNLWERTRFQAGVLVLASLGYSYTAWLKLGAFWGDPARSLFEFYRAANGEIPYRDFSFAYPPLAIALISPVLRWFGATFQVAQLTYDLLGFGCVFGVWFLARRLMPSRAAFLTTLGFLFCGGGGALAVFHLRTYSPSNLVGFIGIVLSCAGLVDAIRGKFDHRTMLLLGIGGFFSCMGRPDAAAGVVAGLLCLIVSEDRSALLSVRASVRRWLRLAAVMLGPSFLCYSLLVAKLGKPIVEGVTAYGLASFACPLWPTGLGLVGAAVALGAVLAALGLLELAGRLFFSVPLRPSPTLYLLAVAGGVAWLWNWGVVFFEVIRHEGAKHGLLDVAAILVNPWIFMSSVRWASTLLFFAGLAAYRRVQGATNAEDRIFFVLMGVMTALSLRGFFNSVNSDTPEVPATLAALTFPLFPSIAWQTVRVWTSGRWTDSSFEMRHRRRIFLLASLWLCLFGGVRVVGDALRDSIRPYRLIQTAAGPVRLNDGGVSKGVYEFLKKNTTPGEPIADVAYGGGVNFALHRTSPLYTTMFEGFLPSEAQRRRDHDQLRESNVRFVISTIPPPFRYGTRFGCAFPRFVWKTEGCTDPPTVTFPVMDLIEEQYLLAGRFDAIAMYVRRASPAPWAPRASDNGIPFSR